MLDKGKHSLDDHALDQLFREARIFNAWTGDPLPDDLPRTLYEPMKWGPTSANVSPARFVFVTTPEGKARLSPHPSNGNRDKAMALPMCVIIAQDMDFADKLPFLAPTGADFGPSLGRRSRREVR